MTRAIPFETSAALSVERAVEDAANLLLSAEAHSVMLSELGVIHIPQAASANPMQIRAVASLYLASALESAGLIQAVDALTRMVRSGQIMHDLGDATGLIVTFWENRKERAAPEERQALFASLFGSPADVVDSFSGTNNGFEERLFALCEAIIDAADGGPLVNMRRAARRLSENLVQAGNDMVLIMARDIIASLSRSIAILNHPKIRTALGARSLWQSVAAIDRRQRRPVRPTLNHLRRGRAGMVLLAWLGDFLEQKDASTHRPTADAPVLAAALDWVDETITLIEAVDGSRQAQRGSASESTGSWLDLGR